MPVSTFSSDNSALRGHSGMIERWNSTRERMREDERRVSMSEMNEMDGTGLYERPDWPLGEERSVSPEAVLGRDDVRRASGRVDKEAVVRKSEDIGSPIGGSAWLDEPDVSDVEDEVEDGSPGYNRYDEQLGHRRGLEEGQDEVSPARDGSTQPYRSPSVADSLNNDRDGARKTSQVLHSPRLRQTQVSPVSEQSPPAASYEEGHPSPRSNGNHRFQDPTRTPSMGSVARGSMQNGDTYDVDAEELRDVATPIPFGRESFDSPRPSHAPSTPQMNGNATPIHNSQPRASSIAKGTPPSRSASRSSHHQTTQISYNKDRVRYSWQSLQDDEPNRPRIHIIKLVSEVATASAGFPGGEAFGFSISPGGRRIAAYNSARLYVLQTAALPVGISQDYALKRRPLAVEINDEGNLLAILADEHTVNVYDLGHPRIRRSKTVKLDFPTSNIALAPTGGLLAAAYEGGVEIFSLAPSALSTDRRAVRCQKMDRMTFSEDGSTLLGTTTGINVSSTMVVSVPVFPAAPSGVPTHEELKEAWCSELLHPENVRNSSHATFMRENRQSCNDRMFAWNGLADTFGILNISDMQYGNVDFPVVISPPLSTCGGLGAAIHSCPAIDEHGDTVAMIVNDRTIRLYIVPHKAGDNEATVEAHSIDHELDEGYGCPFHEARWVHSSVTHPAPSNHQTQVQGRLIVTSPGGVAEPGLSEDTVDDIEGGRIILFDFDPQFAGQPGQTYSLTLGKSPPQMLEEETVNVAEEVALVRRRTVNQSKSGGLSQRAITLGRAATTFNGGRALRNASPSFGPSSGRRSVLSIHSMQSEASRSLPDLVETNENGGEALDEPYAQNAPRSYASLQRAASNAQRHRFQALEERSQERVSVDSNGGFLPLPEYTEEPNAPLPSRFRAMAGLDAPPQPAPKPAIVTSVSGDRPSPVSSGPSTAPAVMAETFSAEQAFATAQATFNAQQQQRQDAVAAGMQRQSPTSPVRVSPKSDTFSSNSSMPRSLQRAYSNAISPLRAGPPPPLIGDWENVSPVVRVGSRGSTPSPASPRSGTFTTSGSVPPSATAASVVPEEEAWDPITPVQAPSQQHASPYDRVQQASQQHNRYSTSLLNPPGHSTAPSRAPSDASYLGTSASVSGASDDTSSVQTGRRVPPHIQAFRNAAAAAAFPSIFPPTQESNQVPHRTPPAKAGAVAHPITAWHPPAPSSSVGASSAPGSVRGVSRKNSVASKSAFASTAKAKKLGFFKSEKKQPFASGAHAGNERGGRGGVDMMETKGVATGATNKGETKCSVM